MAETTPGKPRKIVLIHSEDSADQVRAQHPDKQLFDVELFVRPPDKSEDKEFAVAARLCNCRQVCLAFVDPD